MATTGVDMATTGAGMATTGAGMATTGAEMATTSAGMATTTAYDIVKDAVHRPLQLVARAHLQGGGRRRVLAQVPGAFELVLLLRRLPLGDPPLLLNHLLHLLGGGHVRVDHLLLRHGNRDRG
eukprot:6769961-Pyramimonas_sp.AAC.1